MEEEISSIPGQEMMQESQQQHPTIDTAIAWLGEDTDVSEKEMYRQLEEIGTQGLEEFGMNLGLGPTYVEGEQRKFWNLKRKEKKKR
jgi:hypothetical protein